MRAIVLAVLAVSLWSSTVLAQYSDAVEQWRPIVQEKCGGGTDCEARVMWLIACESVGDPGAAAYNPVSGNMTLGLLQIDEQWGWVAYADGESQITWTVAHLGSVWWAC